MHGTSDRGRTPAPGCLFVRPGHDRHRFAMIGRRFYVDAESGAVHELDAVAWDVLTAAEEIAGPGGGTVPVEALVARLRGRHPEPDLLAAALELTGVLPAPETEARATVRAEAAADSPRAAWPPLKNLTLHTVHGCNLRCHYCFAGDGTFRGPRGRMHEAIARRAVDLLLASPEPEQTLEFSGGEPLLDFPLIRSVTVYAKERAREAGKRLRFILNTNGVALDQERAAFLAEHRFRVVVSVDGRPSTHDAMRPRAGGRGSYGRAVEGARRLAAVLDERDLCVRAVFTRRNLDFAADVLHLADLGFRTITLEPVATDPAQPYALRREDLPAVRAEYRRLAQLLAARWRKGERIRFLPFHLDPDAPFVNERRSRGCGAAVTSLTVTPWGEVYPCHGFAGLEAFRLGRVTSGVDRPGLLEEFAAADLAGTRGCDRCWARYYCGGGCHAAGFRAHGDIRRPDALECEMRRCRIECAIWLASEGLYESHSDSREAEPAE